MTIHITKNTVYINVQYEKYMVYSLYMLLKKYKLIEQQNVHSVVEEIKLK